MKDMVSEPFMAEANVHDGYKTFKIVQHTGAYVEVYLVPDMSRKDKFEFEALIENLGDTLDTMVAAGPDGMSMGKGRDGSTIWVEDRNEEKR